MGLSAVDRGKRWLLRLGHVSLGGLWHGPFGREIGDVGVPFPLHDKTSGIIEPPLPWLTAALAARPQSCGDFVGVVP